MKLVVNILHLLQQGWVIQQLDAPSGQVPKLRASYPMLKTLHFDFDNNNLNVEVSFEGSLEDACAVVQELNNANTSYRVQYDVKTEQGKPTGRAYRG